jgi:hypothetical protein
MSESTLLMLTIKNIEGQPRSMARIRGGQQVQVSAKPAAPTTDLVAQPLLSLHGGSFPLMQTVRK